MNVISLGLALEMHFAFYDVHVGARHKGMKIRTANVRISYLNKFVIFNLAIKKLWRVFYVFVDYELKSERQLILGLRWLHLVRAVVDIYASILTIGWQHGNVGERRVTIQIPNFKTSVF